MIYLQKEQVYIFLVESRLSKIYDFTSFSATIPKMTKTNILFVDHTPFVGGAQLRLAEDLKYLNRDKIEPVLLIDQASKHESIYKHSKVKIFKIPFSRLNLLHPVAIPRLLNSVKAFSKLIIDLEPDVVVANTTRALLVAALSSKIHRSDFKLICYVRDYDYPKWVFQLIGDEVDKYLFVSKSIQDFYKLSGEVIYLGTSFQPKKAEKSSHKKYTIGYIGRLVDWKGGRELVAAFKKIINKDMQLIFWGTGEGQKGSIEEALKKHSSDQVKFMGHTNTPADAFNKMDSFVLASQKAEPFATSMIEAAVAHVPIIATETGGTSEFIQNERNGLLIKPGDTNQLAAALVRLKDDTSLARKLADQALKDAQKYTEEKFMKRFEKALLT